MTFDEETVLGLVMFGLVKLVGYYFLARWVGQRYWLAERPLPIVVALSRIAVGAVLAGLILSAVHFQRNPISYTLLIPLRIIEWSLVFWYFYERASGKLEWSRLLKLAFRATVISCLLDLPAMFTAVLIPAMAFGIC